METTNGPDTAKPRNFSPAKDTEGLIRLRPKGHPKVGKSTWVEKVQGTRPCRRETSIKASPLQLAYEGQTGWEDAGVEVWKASETLLKGSVLVLNDS